jgi:hypothetical protein
MGLVGWIQYTEHYDSLDKSKEGCSKNPMHCKGKERLDRYTDLINASNQLKHENHYCYYFEPFYQLMRQTLWAEQMINFRDISEAVDFLHIHVIPSANQDLLKKMYKCSGADMETTWRNHLSDQSKYRIISPEKLLGGLDPAQYHDLISYLSRRYW